MTRTESFEKVAVTSAVALRHWLEANHGQGASVWLVTFKKHVPKKYVSRDEVLDELLCFGWIDGIRRKLDDDRTMQLLSPRRTQRWAKSYRDRAARLTAEGRMHPAGMRSIEQAKRSGLWRSMEDVDALVVPDDLARALASRASAGEFFDRLAPSKKRNVLRWIKLAKTPATRTRRIEKTATLAARGETVPHM